ncbi:MAG: hypothetical protein J3Q66DRAFT_365362 [Benniella sp.]|nr:MAG: hypothetical protein J3Q66DRAFT_365362 [Benniella sp.]
MGVKEAWKYLEQEGSKGTEVDTKAISSHIHIDTPSLFRAYITATEHYIVQDQRKQRKSGQAPTKEQLAEAKNVKLASRLNNRLAESFEKSRVTLHFDGLPSEQKKFAHKERTARRETQIKKAQCSILKTQLIIHSDVDSSAKDHHVTPSDSTTAPVKLTSAMKRRVVRSNKQAQKLCKAARTLDPSTKAELTKRLRDDHGWIVCECRGEADVCISSQAGPVTVATSDSDFLFHEVDVVLRQLPLSKKKYHEFHIQQDVLEKLEITANAWRVSGAVTRNDYSRSVEGCDLETNVLIMKSLDENLDSDPESMLLEYCEEVSTLKSLPEPCQTCQFDCSRDIFFYRRETFGDATSPTNQTIDSDMEVMMKDFYAFLRKYAEARKDRKVSQSTAPARITAPVSAETPPSVMASASMTLEVTTATVTAPEPNPLPDQASKEQGRGYKTFMPSNKFRAKAFTLNKQESTHSTPRRKRRKRKQKKRKRPTLYNPCSRKQRMDPTLKTTEPTRTNTLQPATVVKNCLKRYANVSLNCGTLSTQLRRGLASNEVGQEDERGLIQKEVVTVVKEMVRIGTEATICAQQAISLFIARTMSEFPSLSDPDRAARRERLEHIAYFHNDQFFGNLLQDIFMWHNVGPRDGGARSATPANACIENIVNMYRDFLDESGHEVPKLQTVINSNLTPFLQLTGRQFADTLQMHYQRNISELVERVKEHNGAWAQGENGVSVLSSIDNKGNSSDHDPISLFWILNIQLPAEKQFTFVPESGFTDQFFTITEESLLKVLLRKQANPKSFLEEFGTMTNAKKHAADHRGDLVYKLFFSKSLSYDSRVSLINPDTDIPSGHSLWDYGSDNESGDSGGGFLASGSKSEVKDSFQDIIRAAGDGSIKRKYVLTGSFSSNGYEIHVNASNLLREAPKASKKPNTTRSKLNDVLTIPPSESDHHVIVGIDPGIKSTATCCILDSANAARVENMTISQGSHTHVTKTYQKTLERAKKKAGNIQDLEATILPIQGTTWAEVGDSIEQRILSRLEVHEPLRQFYGSDIFKMKAFHRKQALTATKNKGIDRVIAAARSTEVEPCFVVGDGEFGSSSKTLHQDFISLLKKKIPITGRD